MPSVHTVEALQAGRSTDKKCDCSYARSHNLSKSTSRSTVHDALLRLLDTLRDPNNMHEDEGGSLHHCTQTHNLQPWCKLGLTGPGQDPPSSSLVVEDSSSSTDPPKDLEQSLVYSRLCEWLSTGPGSAHVYSVLKLHYSLRCKRG